MAYGVQVQAINFELPEPELTPELYRVSVAVKHERRNNKSIR